MFIASESEHECDIVMPVYNGLTYVREAIDSIRECTGEAAWRLLIVDDASDAPTARYLASVAEKDARIAVLRQPDNLGFVQACIRGRRASTAPFLCLLNSDVVVTPGWLDRLLACARSDPRIAAVNPLTNHAANLDVPMLPGANFLSMDELVRLRPPRYPDVVTGVGFCLLLRQEALRQVGFFDPIYGRGYCEESDLCMRLVSHGFRTVAADNVYVYHKGSASFGADRTTRYLANRRIFDQRWLPEYRRQFRAFRKADPLRQVRSLVPMRNRADPLPLVWQTGRELRDALRARAPLTAARAAARGLVRLPSNRRPLANASHLRAVTRPGRLRVTYLLPRVLLAGGVLAVIQIVNGLIRAGVEARILTLFEDPLVKDWTPLYTQPAVFPRPAALVDACSETDIVIATHWSTAAWARAILDTGRARTGAYFLQDYEPWFFSASDDAARARVRATFGLLPHRIVTSDWLATMLAREGYATRKIRLGIDLDRFYPRERRAGPLSVLAMARPGTPYRGFNSIVSAFERIKAERPDVTLRLFGDARLARRDIPFAFDDLGLITDQERLAHAYADADIFIDGSDFQGFGLCGLEAMACGAACVLTNAGGVNEYASHGVNALLVDPADPEALAAGALALLSDPARRADLAEAGTRTARAFCVRREVSETLAFFDALAGDSRPAEAAP